MRVDEELYRAVRGCVERYRPVWSCPYIFILMVGWVGFVIMKDVGKVPTIPVENVQIGKTPDPEGGTICD